MRNFLILLNITIYLSLTGCLTNNESVYLTPVTDATLSAYRNYHAPVKNELDAAIVALLSIQTTRYVNIGDPTVVYVEQLGIAEAYEKVGEHRLAGVQSKDKQVWLVFFEGEWQLIFPISDEQGVTPTLAPPFHGCMFSIIDADDGGSFAEGGFSCPAETQ